MMISIFNVESFPKTFTRFTSRIRYCTSLFYVESLFTSRQSFARLLVPGSN